MRATIIKRADGGVSVCAPIENAERRAEVLSKWAQSALPEWLPASIETADVNVPADRYFRNAWDHSLNVRMPKAREIHRDRLREMRAPMLAALDVEYQRADERDNTTEKRRIAARKQELRDVTSDPAIEAAQTPEELKAVIPTILRS